MWLYFVKGKPTSLCKKNFGGDIWESCVLPSPVTFQLDSVTSKKQNVSLLSFPGQNFLKIVYIYLQQRILSLCCFVSPHLLPKKSFFTTGKVLWETREAKTVKLPEGDEPQAGHGTDFSYLPCRQVFPALPSGGCCSQMPTSGLSPRAETHSSGSKTLFHDVLCSQKEAISKAVL